MSIFSLIDCNNFYASCERVFNPHLDGKAIVVLSNNDGCIVARSQEAKKLGIPMGAPFFQWEKLCDKKILFAFSSNYALYGDMSNRVMTILQDFCTDLEVYSIDEAFLCFDGFNEKDLVSYSSHIRKTIKAWTGLPVSIGIASTKTLAKIANSVAKKKTIEGVFDLRNPTVCENILSVFPVENIWGIGHGFAKRLNALNIKTAKNLRDANLKMIRANFSIVMERLVEELRGISCIPLEIVQPRKQIMSSRSFGKLVTDINELEEAISHYTAKACLKLRKQNSLAGGINIFLHTNYFREKEPQYGNSISYKFLEPICDNSYIISAAKKCLQKIYRSGFCYKKAGIMLLDLSPQTIKQFDLFSIRQNKSDSIMQALDSINEKIGENTLYFAAEGVQRSWRTRCSRRSPRYTTQWNELAKVICKI